MQQATGTSSTTKTTAPADEVARAADQEAAEDFAWWLRAVLALTPDMPRFHQGRDQHRLTYQVIRLARERVRDQAALDGDDVIAAGYTAAVAWHRFIYLEKATGAALEYVQALSPWAFCRFLGDLMVAGVKTGTAQDRYFCELATRVTTAARIRSEVAPGERLAQQHIEILRLADRPHLADPTFDLRVAPYVAWITYRREAGATETTWEAAVSGHRVLPNGVVDMDARTVTLRSGIDEDVTPAWLMGLIEKYAPNSW
ncbi:hypothetical protein ACFZDK_49120 [Streptomyces sp. NPDC007901]|uniref:hypothetical protein n=1 Tax=Streptomyces sp. NPDC007901 TaxID=3364785 RepID=UPI0036F0B3A4